MSNPLHGIADLCAANDKFPRQAVAKFRGRSTVSVKLIGAKSVEGFIEFLVDIQDND